MVFAIVSYNANGYKNGICSVSGFDVPKHVISQDIGPVLNHLDKCGFTMIGAPVPIPNSATMIFTLHKQENDQSIDTLIKSIS